jgi:L-serine dehydratase
MQIKDSLSVIEYCKEHQMSLYEYMVAYEQYHSQKSEEQIHNKMERMLNVMFHSIHEGLHGEQIEQGKIISRKAKDVYDFATNNKGQLAAGDTVMKAVAYGLGVMEVNVTMGEIVAAPTAGASGIIPGVFKSLKETFDLSQEQLIEGLFVAGLIGSIIARNASISGAKGGCQAEVGSGSAMAAGAGLYMLGESMENVFHGAAITLKNLMGLVCDPVAGLVEVPCQKRNAIGVTNSLIAIDMIRAGMVSYIPFDQVVEAMKRVGDLMPACHRETGTGGIADTPVGQLYRRKIFAE